MKKIVFATVMTCALFMVACGGNASSNAAANGGGNTPATNGNSGGGEPKKEAVEITVFAAASMTDAVNELKGALEKGSEFKLKTSYGASSDLARQIMEGAPCDVFISADQAWMDKVKDKDALDGASKIMARNKLVCIAKADSALKAAKPEDLQGEEFKKFAIADENVPAGKYARAALTYYKIIDVLKPRFVGQKDVRAALKAVSSGELEAGFVYSTDAKVDKGVKVLFEFDPASHAKIVYPIAVCKGSKASDAAKKFMAYVLGKEAQDTLAKFGFGPGDAP